MAKVEIPDGIVRQMDADDRMVMYVNTLGRGLVIIANDSTAVLLMHALMCMINQIRPHSEPPPQCPISDDDLWESAVQLSKMLSEKFPQIYRKS